jgi:hypothetical protein
MPWYVPLALVIGLAVSWYHGTRAARQLSTHGRAFRDQHRRIPAGAGEEFFTAAGWRHRRRMHLWGWGGFVLAVVLWAVAEFRML